MFILTATVVSSVWRALMLSLCSKFELGLLSCGLCAKFGLVPITVTEASPQRFSYLTKNNVLHELIDRL